MLDLAYRHIQPLQERYQEALFKDRYRFFWTYPDIKYYIPVYDNLGDMLQFVSLDSGGRIIGYFGCCINRDTRSASDLEMISFEGKNAEFTADLYAFLDRVFRQFGVERMYWSVVIGNPSEVLYDRLVNTYGGRIVGTFTNHVRLYDGNLYDVKFYEIYKDKIYAGLDKAGVNPSSYRDFNKNQEVN